MGIISGLIAMVGWGCADFLAAISSRKVGNLRTYFWMQLIGFLLAFVYFIFNFQTFNLSLLPNHLMLLLGVAIFQVLAYLSFYKGMEKGMVSIVSPIGSTFALITVILSVIFFHEQLSNRQTLAILIVFLGIFLASTNIQDLLKIKKLSVLKGVKEALIAMLGWGISLFLIVPASKELGWFLPVFVFRFIAILILAGIFLIKKESFVVKKNRATLLPLLFIGILDIAAFFGYSLGVSSEYASIVAPVSGAFAMVTIVLARIFLKEKLATNQLIGIAGIILGIILISI